MRTVYPNSKRKEFRDDSEIISFVNTSKGAIVSDTIGYGDKNEMVEGESRIDKTKNTSVIKINDKLYHQVVDKDSNVILEELV